MTPNTVVFRPFTSSDADTVALLLNDADMSRWTSKIPYPYTRDDALAWIAQQSACDSRKPLAVIANAKLVGCVAHWPVDDDTTEIGYWIGKPYWGKGYATQALTLMLALNSFPSTAKVIAKIAKPNTASQYVVRKCDFECTGDVIIDRQGQPIEGLSFVKNRP